MWVIQGFKNSKIRETRTIRIRFAMKQSGRWCSSHYHQPVLLDMTKCFSPYLRVALACNTNTADRSQHRRCGSSCYPRRCCITCKEYMRLTITPLISARQFSYSYYSWTRFLISTSRNTAERHRSDRSFAAGYTRMSTNSKLFYHIA